MSKDIATKVFLSANFSAQEVFRIGTRNAMQLGLSIKV